MQQVGRYQLIEEIGKGGMAVVYRAQDTLLQRDVALKLLAAHLEKKESVPARFIQEAQIIAQLEHPHIVPIYDFGTHEERPFLVMRWLRGGTMRERLHNQTVPPEKLWPIAAQVALALDKAHDHDVIHRDIKPSNILFDEQGTAYVSDFGVAKMANATTRITQHNRVVGTPAYMSPEQCAEGELNGRSDQYSLAIVLFEALAGQRPFSGDTLQIMYKHTHEAPPDLHTLNANLTPAVTPVMQRALAKKPQERFRSVTAFVTALQHAATTPVQPTANEAIIRISTDIVEPYNPNYEKGLQAMERRSWRLAIAAFQQVPRTDPFYHQAMSQRRTAENYLQQARPRPRPATTEPTKQADADDPSTESDVTTLPKSKGIQEKLAAISHKQWWWVGGVLLLLLGLPLLILGVNAVNNNDPTPTAPTETVIDGATSEPLPSATLQKAEIRVVAAGEDARWQTGGISMRLQVEDMLPVPAKGIPLILRNGRGTLIIQLPDDSVLFLAENSEANIETIAGFVDAPTTQVEIISGKLVISSASKPTIVKNRLGSQIQSTAALLGITNQRQPLRFEAACLLYASCVVTGDLGGAVELAPGEATVVGGSGNPTTPRAARFEQYAWANLVPTATITPTATDTPTATATPTLRPTRPLATATSVPLTPTVLPTPTPGDADLDGVRDDVDNCPGEFGPGDRQGCPRNSGNNNPTPSY